LHANEAIQKFGYETVGKKLDIIEPREEDPEKVVIEKANQAFQILKKPLIVEDSGIFIKALNGFPKTFVHFVEDTVGIKGILKMLEGVTDRYVEFRQSLAYIEPGMDEPKVFSYVDGNYTIADRVWIPKYESGEFDKILIPPGEKQPLCMFPKEWRAKRDTETNQLTIHYRQLVVWLGSR
jgi:non-canonical purine NTP pyrophosphatase (RdgB/HAM1 family)